MMDVFTKNNTSSSLIHTIYHSVLTMMELPKSSHPTCRYGRFSYVSMSYLLNYSMMIIEYKCKPSVSL